jgi:hypothetical protein
MITDFEAPAGRAHSILHFVFFIFHFAFPPHPDFPNVPSIQNEQSRWANPLISSSPANRERAEFPPPVATRPAAGYL